MPTTPGPKKRSAAPRVDIDSLEDEVRGRVGAESPLGSGKRAASDSPRTEPLPKGGKRTPKNRSLEDKVARFYMVAGTVLLPFKRFYPPLEPISTNLKSFSQEAAEAWVDLAEEDPKVKKWLESITSASTWGNVIGIHFAIFASAIPRSMNSATSGIIPEGINPLEFAKSMGLSDAEIAMAMKMAGMDTGGPGDTVRTNSKPEPPIEEIRKEENFNSNAGIATPGQMGVENPGDEYNGPQMTGGIK